MTQSENTVHSSATLVVPHTAHHKKPTKIEISFESVTPEQAKLWLAVNYASQRKVNRNTVTSYAEQMRKGLWYGDNGEAIKFSTTGLIDGQHRLLAVVEYGQPVVMLIIRGLPDEHMQAMDMGKKRSLADILKIHGHDPIKGISNHLLSSVVSGLYVVKSYIESENPVDTESFRIYSNVRSRGTPIEIYDFFLANPQIAERLAKLSKHKIATMSKNFPAGPVVLAWFIADILDEKMASELLDTFVNLVPQSEQGVNCPAYRLLLKIRQLVESKEHPHKYEYPAYFLWAMDHMLQGKTASRVKLMQRHMPGRGHTRSSDLIDFFNDLEYTQL
jgi:hypothetical protein